LVAALALVTLVTLVTFRPRLAFGTFRAFDSLLAVETWRAIAYSRKPRVDSRLQLDDLDAEFCDGSSSLGFDQLERFRPMPLLFGQDFGKRQIPRVKSGVG